MVLSDADLARFHTKYTWDEMTGCMLWTDALSQGRGYGHFHVEKKHRLAHRVAYEQFVGPIPEGLQIDHLCRQRSCVNPEHMEAVTPRTNVLRGVGPSAVHSRKTTCPAGHPYDEVNTLWERGRRRCRLCRQAERRRAAVKRANR